MSAVNTFFKACAPKAPNITAIKAAKPPSERNNLAGNSIATPNLLKLYYLIEN
jgi:hypothetical protein